MLNKKFAYLNYRHGLLLVFIIGFVVRLIPELVSFPNPIGWDTIYYASRINSETVFTVGSDLVNLWLVYRILVSVGNITNLPHLQFSKSLRPPL